MRYLLGAIILLSMGCQKEGAKDSTPANTYKGSVSISGITRVKYGNRIQKDSISITLTDVVAPTYYKLYCGGDNNNSTNWTTGKLMYNLGNSLKNTYLIEK